MAWPVSSDQWKAQLMCEFAVFSIFVRAYYFSFLYFFPIRCETILFIVRLLNSVRSF